MCSNGHYSFETAMCATVPPRKLWNLCDLMLSPNVCSSETQLICSSSPIFWPHAVDIMLVFSSFIFVPASFVLVFYKCFPQAFYLSVITKITPPWDVQQKTSLITFNLKKRLLFKICLASVQPTRTQACWNKDKEEKENKLLYSTVVGLPVIFLPDSKLMRAQL